jgi:hypothetical protein
MDLLFSQSDYEELNFLLHEAVYFYESSPHFQNYIANYERFEVSAAVTMKNCAFLDVMPCGKNRRFGGT